MVGENLVIEALDDLAVLGDHLEPAGETVAEVFHIAVVALLLMVRVLDLGVYLLGQADHVLHGEGGAVEQIEVGGQVLLGQDLILHMLEAVGQDLVIGHAAALIMEVLEELELGAALAQALEVADIVVIHGVFIELGKDDLAVIVIQHPLVTLGAPAAAVIELGVVIIAYDQALIGGLHGPVDELGFVVFMPGAQAQPADFLVFHFLSS